MHCLMTNNACVLKAYADSFQKLLIFRAIKLRAIAVEGSSTSTGRLKKLVRAC
jgi:hypothetical protein